MLGKRRPIFSIAHPHLDWPATQGALRRKGFRRVGDVEAGVVTPGDLSTKDYHPTPADVAAIQDALTTDDITRDPARALPVSAAQLYQESKARPGAKVISFCKAIDAMLGGGVHKGQLTEIAGLPGTGKTQIAMQLAIDARIPKGFKGAGQQAVYIDTEGAFMAGRAAEMAQALIDHLRRIVKGGKATPEQQQEVEALTLEAVLGGVHVFRCLDDAELLATLQHLPAFVDAHPEVGLLVLDSLGFPFRQDAVFQTETPVNTARIVGALARELCRMAQDRGLAVVVTNQLTTKVDDSLHPHYAPTAAYAWGGGGPGGGPPLAPTLGESWAPAPAVRLHLWTAAPSYSSSSSSSGGNPPPLLRCATLVKSASQRRATVHFRINHLGVRDVATGTAPAPRPPTAGAAGGGGGQQGGR